VRPVPSSGSTMPRASASSPRRAAPTCSCTSVRSRVRASSRCRKARRSPSSSCRARRACRLTRCSRCNWLTSPAQVGSTAENAGGASLRRFSFSARGRSCAAPPVVQRCPMLTVHHLDNSRSQRVLWLLEELELPYRVVHHSRDPKTLLAPAALRAVHPLGKAPVLVDDNQALAESGAILEYLVERYDTAHAVSPPPVPAMGPERLLYRYWMHYAEGSAMPPMLLTLVLGRIRNAPMPFFARPVARALVDRTMAAF